MSFLETFTECSQTYTNLSKPGPSGIDTPNPCLEDSQDQLTQIDLDTPSSQQVTNAAASDALPPPPPSKKRKKADSSNLDLQILAALKEPEKNDDPDGHLSFWQGLQPMLKQLNSLEALKFKHEVHGLLITYIERSRSQRSHLSTLHTVHPTSFPATHGYRSSILPSPTPSSVESHDEYEQNDPRRPAYYHDEQYFNQI